MICGFFTFECSALSLCVVYVSKVADLPEVQVDPFLQRLVRPFGHRSFSIRALSRSLALAITGDLQWGLGKQRSMSFMTCQ